MSEIWEKTFVDKRELFVRTGAQDVLIPGIGW